MVQATARHLLVSSEEKCEALKQEILGGADFADVRLRVAINVKSKVYKWERQNQES